MGNPGFSISVSYENPGFPNYESYESIEVSPVSRTVADTFLVSPVIFSAAGGGVRGGGGGARKIRDLPSFHSISITLSYLFGDCFLDNSSGLVGRTTAAMQPRKVVYSVSNFQKNTVIL